MQREGGVPAGAPVGGVLAALQQPGPSSDLVAYQTRESAGFVEITRSSSSSERTKAAVVSGMKDEKELAHELSGATATTPPAATGTV